MKRSRLRLLQTTLAAGGLSAAISSVALAQAPEVTPPPPPPPPPPAATEPAPAPAYPTLSEPTAPATTVVVDAPPPGVTSAEPTAQKEPEPTEDAEAPWYANFSIGGFVDAYAAVRSDRNSRPQFGGVPAGGYFHEAYVQANGFALAFAGLDATYSGDKLGATISLRFGPGVNRFYAANMTDTGIENITQAYVTYKPIDKLTFDLGQFGTIYGAEVLESWKNINYSRGALYYAMQPFWHTGLRANVAVTDGFALNALIVNGVNNAFENNKSPSLGLQAVITTGDVFTLSAGYLGALNPLSASGAGGVFHNFFDVVATITTGGFKLVANADLNLYKPGEGAESESFWGISVAPSYAFNDFFGIGARVEYLADSANQWGMTTNKIAPSTDDPENGAILADKASLTTLTATLDIKPIPGSAALILRPEFRFEIAGDNYFQNRDSELTKTFWTLALGAVVTSL
ncbi:MAG: porin [Polyangiales bacterium]